VALRREKVRFRVADSPTRKLIPHVITRCPRRYRRHTSQAPKGLIYLSIEWLLDGVIGFIRLAFSDRAVSPDFAGEG
jgi:hypothetical protein